MPGKTSQPRVTPPMLNRMLARASRSAAPVRDKVIILLSVKAGLRACEIANLDWSMVLDARGNVADTIAVRDAIAKKGSGRRIPTHPDLRRALMALRNDSRPIGPVIRSAKGGHFRPNSIVNWFGPVRRAGLRRMLVAFRAADFHHVGGPQHSSLRL
jgi:integrase